MENAESILTKLKTSFKAKEEQIKWLECELLLSLCHAQKSKSVSEFKKFYFNNFVKQANAVGLELKGQIAADAEWKIYNFLYNKGSSAEDKKYVEDTHLKKALTESSRS